jgi:hypothetical protein
MKPGEPRKSIETGRKRMRTMIKTDKTQSKALKIPATGCGEYARSSIHLRAELSAKEKSAVIHLYPIR